MARTKVSARGEGAEFAAEVKAKLKNREGRGRKCRGLSGEDLGALREEERLEASGALLIAEGAKRSSPTPSTRDPS